MIDKYSHEFDENGNIIPLDAETARNDISRSKINKLIGELEEYKPHAKTKVVCKINELITMLIDELYPEIPF